ncbi:MULTISPECIES: ribosomal maturation YjgA family protein [unclassified Rhizobium]|uniref:ribosomal maturation YjgA family protein n=1 Tax=unclassified Rhizobium TaxID=2613769 RepID=UPI001780D4F1|nr:MULTISPECIES: DUF2809 domain-containing protein [unclassified Rhizobium]MBD8689781.1 DUF2809 domain-containing protein [Rhizobium sp. CFBP 13644]MBD8693345.1 DUF2809 domain-containing protein [Rhizobium sp. CFBP 13717]
MIEYRHRLFNRRACLLAATCGVILAGLVLRRFGYDIGLPFVVVKYGGSILWGSMVFLLVASLLPCRNRGTAIVVACSVAVVVELIRLVHFPALDAFRATTAGALLLGRVFSLWNIACYLAGIGLAAVIASRVSET